MTYSSDHAVRYYIDANGSGVDGFGTDIVGTTELAVNLSDSDSIIDMMLAKRFNVPFTTVPPAIRTTAKVLTAWRTLRSVYSGEIPAAIQFVQDDYEKAMEWLKELKDETVDLPTGTGAGNVVAEKGQDNRYWSSMGNYIPVFAMDDAMNQQVDPDLIEDIADERD